MAAEPQAERSSRLKHVSRDHSYVMGDLWRIGFIVAFVTGGIIITAILR